MVSTMRMNLNTIESTSTLWQRLLSLAGKPLLAMAFAGLLLAGCTSQRSSTKDSNARGTYTLISVDGKKTPCTAVHQGANLKIESGVFTMKSDGNCSSVILFVPPSGTAVSKEVSGSYSQNGSSLEFRWKGAGTTKGTVDGDTFTMNNEGMVFAYKRQGAVPAP